MDKLSGLSSLDLPEQPEHSRTSLDARSEEEFQRWIRDPRTTAGRWFSEYVNMYGEEPDLDIDDYDYRGAFMSGVNPERSPHDQRYHWGSIRPDTGQYLKGENHRTMWKQKYVEKYGIDPDTVGATINDL